MDPPVSPFDTLESTFRVLGSGPGALSLDGRLVGCGLPPRPIPLVDLRAHLLDRSVPYEARDAVLNALLAWARRRGGAWTVALAGMLLPGLRRTSAPVMRGCPKRRPDLEAEMLAGLLEAAAKAPATGERVAASLVWAAVRRGHRLLRAELAHSAHTTPAPHSCPPPRPWGHPDLVLDQAAREGVISFEDAELIGATRLGGVPLRTFARQMDEPYGTVKKRRWRAETRVAAWLGAEDSLSPNRPPERV